MDDDIIEFVIAQDPEIFDGPFVVPAERPEVDDRRERIHAR